MNDLQQCQEQLFALKLQATELQSNLLQHRLGKDDIEPAKQQLDALNQQIEQLSDKLIELSFVKADDIHAVYQARLNQIQTRPNITTNTLYLNAIHQVMKELPPSTRYYFQKKLLIMHAYINEVHKEQCQEDIQKLNDLYARMKQKRKQFLLKELWWFVVLGLLGGLFFYFLILLK